MYLLRLLRDTAQETGGLVRTPHLGGKAAFPAGAAPNGACACAFDRGAKDNPGT